jgi:hypothetical protein
MNEIHNQILFCLTINKKLTYPALLAKMNHYIDTNNDYYKLQVSEALFDLMRDGIVKSHTDRRIVNQDRIPTLTFSLRRYS